MEIMAKQGLSQDAIWRVGGWLSSMTARRSLGYLGSPGLSKCAASARTRGDERLREGLRRGVAFEVDFACLHCDVASTC